jgi:CBS domain containing-hemolysin-like protein
MGFLSLIVIVILSVLLAGFFAGSETAVVSCSKVKLRYKAKRGGRRARMLERLLDSPELFFSIVLVGTNVAVIVCTASATAIAFDLFGESGVAVATLVMTPLLLVFGEVIPKSVFLYHADRVALTVAPLLNAFLYLLYPLVAPATLFARFLLKLFGSKDEHFTLLNSREELISLYRRGKKEGVAERRERGIIDRVFNFQGVTAGDLMIPFERVVSFPLSASVEEVVEEANKHTYSRFPIVDDADSVVGIISMFDLLGLDGGEELATVMHEPYFARDDDLAVKTLVRMKDEALHIAVVVDDDMTALGILTIENIFESIVGDIDNEYE